MSVNTLDNEDLIFISVYLTPDLLRQQLITHPAPGLNLRMKLQVHSGNKRALSVVHWWDF